MFYSIFLVGDLLDSYAYGETGLEWFNRLEFVSMYLDVGSLKCFIFPNTSTYYKPFV